MRIDEIGKQPCSVAKALSEIGDTWSMLILREAFYGRTRFSEFAERTGAQRTVVSARLKALVETGILERHRYSDHPPRDEYHLTEKGLDLAPVLLTLTAWGDKWAGSPRGPRVTLTHTCGHHAAPVTVCGSCDEPLRPEDLTPSAGPGFPRSHADPFHRAGS